LIVLTPQAKPRTTAALQLSRIKLNNALKQLLLVFLKKMVTINASIASEAQQCENSPQICQDQCRELRIGNAPHLDQPMNRQSLSAARPEM
jgi:hypothetical protein